MRVPWTARRSNQSILKEISSEYSLEGLMLKLKLQNFGHLMWRTDSLEKTLMLGKTEGGKRRVRQRMRRLDGSWTWWTWVWVSSGNWWWTGKPGMLQSMGSHESWTRLSDWTELHYMTGYSFCFGNKDTFQNISWLGLRDILKKLLVKGQIYSHYLFSSLQHKKLYICIILSPSLLFTITNVVNSWERRKPLFSFSKKRSLKWLLAAVRHKAEKVGGDQDPIHCRESRHSAKRMAGEPRPSIKR